MPLTIRPLVRSWLSFAVRMSCINFTTSVNLKIAHYCTISGCRTGAIINPSTHLLSLSAGAANKYPQTLSPRSDTLAILPFFRNTWNITRYFGDFSVIRITRLKKHQHWQHWFEHLILEQSCQGQTLNASSSLMSLAIAFYLMNAGCIIIVGGTFKEL